MAGLLLRDGDPLDLAVLHEDRLRALHIGREGALLAGNVHRVTKARPPEHDRVQHPQPAPHLGPIREDVALRLELKHLPRVQAVGVLELEGETERSLHLDAIRRGGSTIRRLVERRVQPGRDRGIFRPERKRPRRIARETRGNKIHRPAVIVVVVLQPPAENCAPRFVNTAVTSAVSTVTVRSLSSVTRASGEPAAETGATGAAAGGGDSGGVVPGTPGAAAPAPGLAACDVPAGSGLGGGNSAWYPYNTRNDRNTARRTRFSMNFRVESAEPDRTRDHRMDDTARAAARPATRHEGRRALEWRRPCMSSRTV